MRRRRSWSGGWRPSIMADAMTIEIPALTNDRIGDFVPMSYLNTAIH